MSEQTRELAEAIARLYLNKDESAIDITVQNSINMTEQMIDSVLSASQSREQQSSTAA